MSRHGNVIPCPPWFIAEFPKDTVLDGELWSGRGTLENLVKTLRPNADTSSWKSISYVVFDIPHSLEQYEARMENLKNMVLPSHVKVVHLERCTGNDHLLQRLAEIVQGGGEGLMVNKPQSLYLGGQRTNILLKVKVRLVISHPIIFRC